MSLLPQLSQSDLTALLSRILPDHVQSGLGSGEDGQEFFEGLALAYARLSQRVIEADDGKFIATATGATRATGSITVTWSAGTSGSPDGAVAIQAGQTIVKTAWGVEYQLTETLSAGNSEAGGYNQTVGVEAVWSGWDGNVDAADVNAWALPSGVDPSAAVEWDEGLTGSATAKQNFLDGVDDGTITFTATAMTGGALGTLDLIGAGRGLPRAPDESDVAYRKRLRQLPNVVTPTAILAAVNAALEPYAVTATLLEPIEDAFTIGDSAIGDVHVSRVRHFIVEVPNLGADTGSGLVIGDGEIGDDPIGGETVTTFSGLLGGLQELVNRIKAHGVWGSVIEAL